MTGVITANPTANRLQQILVCVPAQEGQSESAEDVGDIKGHARALERPAADKVAAENRDQCDSDYEAEQYERFFERLAIDE